MMQEVLRPLLRSGNVLDNASSQRDKGSEPRLGEASLAAAVNDQGLTLVHCPACAVERCDFPHCVSCGAESETPLCVSCTSWSFAPTVVDDLPLIRSFVTAIVERASLDREHRLEPRSPGEPRDRVLCHECGETYEACARGYLDRLARMVLVEEGDLDAVLLAAA
jgi:hypothetical protein